MDIQSIRNLELRRLGKFGIFQSVTSLANANDCESIFDREQRSNRGLKNCYFVDVVLSD